MASYKLKAKRKYGDMPQGYEFVVSSSIPTPNAQDIEKRLYDWDLINKLNHIEVRATLK